MKVKLVLLSNCSFFHAFFFFLCLFLSGGHSLWSSSPRIQPIWLHFWQFRGWRSPSNHPMTWQTKPTFSMALYMEGVPWPSSWYDLYDSQTLKLTLSFQYKQPHTRALLAVHMAGERQARGSVWVGICWCLKECCILFCSFESLLARCVL